MIHLRQIINHPYTSNTFVIEKEGSNDIWLIDAGFNVDLSKIINSDENIKGVLLTHAHYDHIQGLNDIINKFPNCVIYCSSHTKNGLYDSKINLSFYHEKPLIIDKSKVQIKSINDTILLYDNINAKVIESPGHNEGSLCFIIDNLFFSGDSYIPRIPVVTKLKSGDRNANVKSLSLIFSLINSDTILCPGHGSIFEGNELEQAVLSDKTSLLTNI